MEYYDKISAGYDELYLDEQKEKIETIKSLIKIDKNSSVLDIGCGTGIGSELSNNYVGFDPSKKLINIAKKKYKKEHSKKFFVEMAENIGKLGYLTKQFDFAICLSAVHHFNSIEDILAEVKKISKIFIVTVLKKIEKHDELLKIIRKRFKVMYIDETTKDTILICDCN